MDEDLGQRFQDALVELNDACDALEAADMDMQQVCGWLREWLDIREREAINGRPNRLRTKH